MSVVRTKRNWVAAYEPQTGDLAVVSRIGTVQVLQAINRYDEAVREAVAIADDMENGIDVLPIDTVELLSLTGLTPKQFIASLTPQEREQMRFEWVASMEDVILHCTDAVLVAKATKLHAEIVNASWADVP